MTQDFRKEFNFDREVRVIKRPSANVEYPFEVFLPARWVGFFSPETLVGHRKCLYAPFYETQKFFKDNKLPLEVETKWFEVRSYDSSNICKWWHQRFYFTNRDSAQFFKDFVKTLVLPIYEVTIIGKDDFLDDAYFWCTENAGRNDLTGDWFIRRTDIGDELYYSFRNKSTATLFKLTFGGK